MLSLLRCATWNKECLALLAPDRAILNSYLLGTLIWHWKCVFCSWHFRLLHPQDTYLAVYSTLKIQRYITKSTMADKYDEKCMCYHTMAYAMVGYSISRIFCITCHFLNWNSRGSVIERRMRESSRCICCVGSWNYLLFFSFYHTIQVSNCSSLVFQTWVSARGGCISFLFLEIVKELGQLPDFRVYSR